mmetsp:Transcript_20248/g.62397  ORF Transcript_20248/g.62397 Transcript_20248/m.62397 type:complete len:208 (+) Transcript_20248:112-735(+)
MTRCFCTKPLFCMRGRTTLTDILSIRTTDVRTEQIHHFSGTSVPYEAGSALATERREFIKFVGGQKRKREFVHAFAAVRIQIVVRRYLQRIFHGQISIEFEKRRLVRRNLRQKLDQATSWALTRRSVIQIGFSHQDQNARVIQFVFRQRWAYKQERRHMLSRKNTRGRRKDNGQIDTIGMNLAAELIQTIYRRHLACASAASSNSRR